MIGNKRKNAINLPLCNNAKANENNATVRASYVCGGHIPIIATINEVRMI
jgi:hypothetical protein